MTLEESRILHFLFIYDRLADRTIERIDFGTDSEKALDAYSAAEKEHRTRPYIDIVLVGSDSIESVKMTHSNYFDGGSRRNVESMVESIRRGTLQHSR